MKPNFRWQLAPSLRRTLERLKNGSAAERQRHENVAPAMFKVLSNPLSAEFRKNLPEVTESVPKMGLASELLRELCRSADGHGVTLTYSVFTHGSEAGEERALLEAHSFGHDLTLEEDDEIWQRPPSKRRP